MKKATVKNHDLTIYEYNSITELVNYIRNTPLLHEENRCSSVSTGEIKTKDTKTKSYEEAEDLLLHGWEYGAKQIKNKMSVFVNTTTKTKPNYGVQGYQACVPRYLQGLPDSMIYSKRISVKQKKVLVINKSIRYSWFVEPDTILEESVKCLQMVKKLEDEGYRVKLNILFSVSESSARNANSYILQGVGIKVCIKQATQRLNLKQISFPLLHPSMLRRILFAWMERIPECKYGYVGCGYGHPVTDDHIIYHEWIGGEYLIPSVLEEKEIKNIEKYKK